MVEIIEQMDLSKLETAYRGSGSAPYHPAMLLSMLIYGYATGVFSSRKRERQSGKKPGGKPPRAAIHEICPPVRPPRPPRTPQSDRLPGPRAVVSP